MASYLCHWYLRQEPVQNLCLAIKTSLMPQRLLQKVWEVRQKALPLVCVQLEGLFPTVCSWLWSTFSQMFCGYNLRFTLLSSCDPFSGHQLSPSPPAGGEAAKAHGGASSASPLVAQCCCRQVEGPALPCCEPRAAATIQNPFSFPHFSFCNNPVPPNSSLGLP